MHCHLILPSFERALISGFFELNFEGIITESEKHSPIGIHKHSNILAQMVARGAHTRAIDQLISILILLNLEPIQNCVLTRVSNNTTSGHICLSNRGIKLIKHPHSGMVWTPFIRIREKNVQIGGDTNNTFFGVNW